MCRYYVDIFNASGCNELVEKFGPWFSLDQNPRAQIFRRNQTYVTDVDSMIRLMRYTLLAAQAWDDQDNQFYPLVLYLCRQTTKMWFCLWDALSLLRYNNFKEDPLSRCEGCNPPENGENAISARSDLNPANGTYPFGALRQRPHGGTDMKVFVHFFVVISHLINLPSHISQFWLLYVFAILPNLLCVCLNLKWLWYANAVPNLCVPLQMTSYEMFQEYGMVAVSGPTWDQVPPFQWSTSPYKDLMHMGQPDVWAFKPIKVTWTP